MNQDRKDRYKSILLNKKAIVLAAAALVVTFTLPATAFIHDNTAARTYEKNQALDGANACGNDKLGLNILCSNTASEVQGDENTVGMTSSQEGGIVVEKPYENLVDEVSFQSASSDEKSQISDAQMSSGTERLGGSSAASDFLDRTTEVTTVTPGMANDQLGKSNSAGFQ